MNKHKFKNHLTVISVYTDLLKKKHKDDAKSLLYLNKISRKTKLLVDQVDSILKDTSGRE